MSGPRIVADAELAHGADMLRSLGELTLAPGRAIGRRHLARADALLVRSVTRVSRELLEGTPVRFVGTATSGADHVDAAWLESAGIALCDAAGCNANAVTDYCLAALGALRARGGPRPEDCRVGLVGGGAVGGLLARKLARAGVDCVVCDPPLAAAGARGLVPLEAVGRCRVASLHTPLTDGGPHPTRGMIGREFLASLPDGAALINTARGAVVDGAALAAALAERPDLTAVCDVWESEPEVGAGLAAKAAVATPHIAGYSRRAKRAAAARLAEGLARAFSLPFDAARFETAGDGGGRSPPDGADPWTWLAELYGLAGLSRRFRRAVAAGQGAAVFEAMRRRQASRPEFRDLLAAAPDGPLCAAAAADGA